MNDKRLKILKETAKQYGITVTENAPQGGIFVDNKRVNINKVISSLDKDKIQYRAYLLHSLTDNIDDFIDKRTLSFEEWKERIKK